MMLMASSIGPASKGARNKANKKNSCPHRSESRSHQLKGAVRAVFAARADSITNTRLSPPINECKGFFKNFLDFPLKKT